MKLFGVHARYANATYIAASKQGMLPQVETELLGFKEVMTKNSGFSSYISNPTVSREAKVDTISKMFDGPKTSSVTKNLMLTMASNNRIGEATKVVDAFSEYMKASRGEVECVITSAVALSKAQAKKVADALKAEVGGKAVAISQVVDPSILGGLTVQIGDKYLDMSVSSKINTFKRSLGSA